jgi:hypothetical protein
MFHALQSRSADVVEYQVTETDLHAFNYWHTLNEQTGNYVRDDVISFFNMHLN